MGSCGRQIPISVTRLHNRGSKIGKDKGAADSVGRAKANDKENDRAKAASDVQTACKGLKAADNVGRKADNKTRVNAAPAAVNADRKVGDNEAPAAVRAVARLAIPSFWLLTRTAMANCRPAKSPAQPHH